MEDTKKPTEAEMKEQSENLGKRLGFLIAASKMSDDEKQALLTLLPQMTGAQLLELTNVLENKFAEVISAGDDAKLVEDLEQVKADYADKQEKINQQALDAMVDLEKKLDK